MPVAKTADTGRRWKVRRTVGFAFLIALLVLTIALFAFGARTELLNGQRMTAMVGQRETLGETPAVRLDANGAALLRFDLSDLDPARIPFFRLDLGDAAVVRKLLFFARADRSGEPFTLGVAEGAETARAAPYFGEERRWTPDVVELFVGLEGTANARIAIDSASLSSGGPAVWLANLRWALPKPGQWTLRSINVGTAQRADLVYLGPASGLSLFVLAASMLTCLIAFATRASPLPLLAVVFLIGWMLLDVAWLRQQLYNVRAALAAAAVQEKRLGVPVDHDTRLARFVTRVDASLPRDPALRILVGSAEEFRGMRAAYHLYPRNAFWERGLELPAPGTLRRGDYLLIVRPSRHRVQNGRLHHPQWNRPGPQVSVALADELGVLLRVR